MNKPPCTVLLVTACYVYMVVVPIHSWPHAVVQFTQPRQTVGIWFAVGTNVCALMLMRSRLYATSCDFVAILPNSNFHSHTCTCVIMTERVRSRARVANAVKTCSRDVRTRVTVRRLSEWATDGTERLVGFYRRRLNNFAAYRFLNRTTNNYTIF